MKACNRSVLIVLLSLSALVLTSIAPVFADETSPVVAAVINDEQAVAVVAAAEKPAEAAAAVAAPEAKGAVTGEKVDRQDDEEPSEICDPLAPMNQVFFHFNDKLYYWGLKPVATGFSYVMPEFARIGFSNAFSNLRSPVNIVNNLLQLQFSRSFVELFRLVFNSVVGIGGFVDASSMLLGIEKQEADFGQTLGMYGLGQGCYLVLPIIGPTSFRDGVGIVGDQFMSPPTYLGYFFLDFIQASGAYAFEKVNSTTFKIGDYELLTNMSLDPYQAQRNAFVQYRRKKVKDAIER